MKLTKAQLQEIIYEEMTTLPKNVDLSKVADLYAYYGLDSYKWDDKTVQRYGQEVVDAAKKSLPTIQGFEKSTADILRKIQNDKMYPLYLEMVKAEDSYQGGRSHITFGDVIKSIAYRNQIK